MFFGDAEALQSAAASGIEDITRSQFSQSQEGEADEYGLTLLQKTIDRLLEQQAFSHG